MARRPKLPDLMGSAEIVALLGVSDQRFAEIRRQPQFPEPIMALRMGPIWLKADVDEWHVGYLERRARFGPKTPADN